MADLRWEKVTIRVFLFVFLVTYIVVQVANVVECKPMRLYWQIVPDPGAPIRRPTTHETDLYTLIR